jgi:hypothetical protein
MVDFRKSLLLAAMALAVGVGTASAQTPGTCAGTTGAPPTLRAEGTEELTGSIVLSCNDVAQGSVNFDVTLNGGTVGITSRNAGAEATVSVAGGATVNGQLVSFSGGTTNGDLRFVGIPITTANPVITISGIRINATTVGLSSGFGTVLAQISVSNGVLPISQVTGGFFVGIVLPGFGGVGSTTNFNLTSCATVVTLPGGVDFNATVKENFPTAFKAQIAGPNTDSETGPVAGALEANSGTQFGVTFGNVPTGITFYIPVSIFSNSPTGTTLAQLVQNPGGTTVVVNSVSVIGGVSYVTVTGGTTYYYNIEQADPSFQETWTIPIYSPGGSLSGSFAPTVTIALSPTTGTNIAPEFLAGQGTGTTTLGASVSNTCQTSLLFPFLTNEAGFDTGISIAATGTDPFGTGVAGGNCAIWLYADASGSAAPATTPTLTIPGGGEGHTTISSIDPGFQGYGIAVCNFTFAHGFAFITDGFGGAGRGLSEGYLPLVITDRPTASTAPGESLGN